MERKSLFGIISISFGIPALVFSVFVREAERLREPGVGYLLNWMDRLGLIRAPVPDQVPEWRPLGPLDLTDDLALRAVVIYSVCFSLWAILMALWASFRREPSLGLSVGFILGVLSLHLHGYQYSMAALLLGVLGKAVIHGFGRARRGVAGVPSGAQQGAS